jgi:antitoxin (DNA-binding transcriptional repressor) of toxin-antitoxin stability system
MEDSIGVVQLRDELRASLTEVVRGNRLVIRSRGRPVALLRPARASDRGRETPLTEFRRTMRATIQRARRRPQVLTHYGVAVAVLEHSGPDGAAA